MGSLKVTLKMDASGPLADGSAGKAAEQWTEKVSQALGDEAVQMLRAFPMNKTGRARGGFENALNVTRTSPYTVSVRGPMTKGTAWAPWLEGTSERNQTTKFKGYGLFRKTRLALQKKAPEIGQKVLDELLAEMGGE